MAKSKYVSRVCKTLEEAQGRIKKDDKGVRVYHIMDEGEVRAYVPAQTKEIAVTCYAEDLGITALAGGKVRKRSTDKLGQVQDLLQAISPKSKEARQILADIQAILSPEKGISQPSQESQESQEPVDEESELEPPAEEVPAPISPPSAPPLPPAPPVLESPTN